MGNVTINSMLNENLQIFQYIKLVDFVHLLKFSRIYFDNPITDSHDASRRAESSQRSPGYRRRLNGAATSFRPVWPAKPRSARSTQVRSGQFWHILDEARPRWVASPYSEQWVIMVSTIQSLSRSLLFDDKTTVSIERTTAPHRSRTRRPGFRQTPSLEASDVFQDTSIGITICSGQAAVTSPPQKRRSLPVILSTLLLNVIVAPRASDHLLELVAKLVAENTWATVSRSHHRGITSPLPPNSPGARRPRPVGRRGEGAFTKRHADLSGA